MEDLDSARVRPGIAERQLDELRAIGLDCDEPVVHQSGRLELSREAIARLEADDLLYACFCTRAEIRAAASAPQGPQPAYPGTCRELSRAERAAREASGRPPALRFRAHEARVAFDDGLLGRYEAAVDDFVVRRGDGTPAYNLAVIIDDAAQGIGQVVRGADLADSTPRQLLLARALGLGEPSYAHVPLILGPDGARLAKRHGAVTLAERQAAGESPAAVRAWLAHSAGLTEPDELVRRFDPARIPREPTRSTRPRSVRRRREHGHDPFFLHRVLDLGELCLLGHERAPGVGDRHASVLAVGARADLDPGWRLAALVLGVVDEL